MKFEIFIALKYIAEKRRQSLLSAIGIGLGITVLVISLGISNGLDKNMINTMLSSYPDVRVTGDSYAIKGYEEYKQAIEKIAGVRAVIPKHNGKAIIKYKNEKGQFIEGVLLDGLELDDLVNGLKFDDKITNGKIDFNYVASAIVGKELFDRIGINIGDTVRLVSHENREIDLKVVGCFKTGLYDYDANAIIVPLRLSQLLFQLGKTVSELDVKLNNINSADSVAKNIERLTGLHTKTWKVLNSQLLKAMALEKRVMVILLSLILLISGFVIAIVMNTMVREKIREIGIMRALGFSKRNVLNIFMFNAIIIGVTGFVFSIIMSGTIIIFIKTSSLKFLSDLYYIPDKVPFSLTIFEFIAIIIFAMIVVLLAALYPARKASRLDPVEALRYE